MVRHAIRFDSPTLREFCQRWRVRELCVFGSILSRRFRPNSDVDLLISFEDKAEWDLMDMVRMREELEAILGRRVDLVSRRGVEDSANWIIRREVLGTAEPGYSQGGSSARSDTL